MYNLTKNRKTKEAQMKLLKQQGVKFNCDSKNGKYPGIYLRPKELSKKEKDLIFSYTYWVGLTAFVQNPSKEMEEDIIRILFILIASVFISTFFFTRKRKIIYGKFIVELAESARRIKIW